LPTTFRFLSRRSPRAISPHSTRAAPRTECSQSPRGFFVGGGKQFGYDGQHRCGLPSCTALSRYVTLLPTFKPRTEGTRSVVGGASASRDFFPARHRAATAAASNWLATLPAGPASAYGGFGPTASSSRHRGMGPWATGKSAINFTNHGGTKTTRFPGGSALVANSGVEATAFGPLPSTKVLGWTAGAGRPIRDCGENWSVGGGITVIMIPRQHNLVSHPIRGSRGAVVHRRCSAERKSRSSRAEIYRARAP